MKMSSLSNAIISPHQRRCKGRSPGCWETDRLRTSKMHEMANNARPCGDSHLMFRKMYLSLVTSWDSITFASLINSECVLGLAYWSVCLQGTEEPSSGPLARGTLKSLSVFLTLSGGGHLVWEDLCWVWNSNGRHPFCSWFYKDDVCCVFLTNILDQVKEIPFYS